MKLFNEDKTPIVFKNRNISMVTGIPMIVQNGKVADNALMLSSDSDFVRKPHARTAVGLDAKGNIMLVAVESDYIKPLSKITLEEVQYILKKKKDIETKTLTLPQLQKIVEEHFSSKNTGRGLSLKELAKFMIEIGCVEAINLDGGGSTAMFFKGKMMNVSIGDEDEAFGEIIRRPVSDAIIVVPRKE